MNHDLIFLCTSLVRDSDASGCYAWDFWRMERSLTSKDNMDRLLVIWKREFTSLIPATSKMAKLIDFLAIKDISQYVHVWPSETRLSVTCFSLRCILLWTRNLSSWWTSFRYKHMGPDKKQISSNSSHIVSSLDIIALLTFILSSFSGFFRGRYHQSKSWDTDWASNNLRKSSTSGGKCEGFKVDIKW